MGTCRGLVDMTYQYFANEVMEPPIAKNFAITATSKQFLDVKHYIRRPS